VAIRFVLPEQESESVAFAYSPVVEAVLSLHVLVAPRHHPLQHAWVRHMRRLDPRLKAEIKRSDSPMRVTFRTSSSRAPTRSSSELAFLHDLEPETLAFEFMRPVYDHTGTWPRDRSLLESEQVRRHVLERCARYGPESEALGRLVFDDPSELGRRFCSLLERYWEEAGVLESRREGYYVLYSLAPERLESLSASLLGFIRRPG
jgi:DNA-binding transcriptional ArsR family regulator